jgi:hypothetical protein
MKLSPLLKRPYSIRCQKRNQPNRGTYGEQFRLRISEAQFDLIYSWAVLEWVGSQVLVSARLGSDGCGSHGTRRRPPHVEAFNVISTQPQPDGNCRLTC